MKLYTALATLLVSLLAACASSPAATPVGPMVETATTTVPVRPTDETAIANIPSLRQLADKMQIQIGCEFTEGALIDSKWKDLVGKVCHLAVVERGFDWSDIEPKPGQFKFGYADSQVAFARAHNMGVRGHLIPFPTTPSTEASPLMRDLTRDELNKIMQNHITQVVSHYKGQISQWVVMNRPYVNPYKLVNISAAPLDYDYLVLAFQTARENDPSAILLYDDTPIFSSSAQETQRETIARLKSKGLIDGVSLRMYLEPNGPLTKQDVVARMKGYGLPVYVTEFGVDLSGIAVAGTTDDVYAAQAKVYRVMLDACLESGVCKSFTISAIRTGYSAYGTLYRCLPDPAAFDDDLYPKPAYFAMIDAFCSALATGCTPTPTPVPPRVASSIPVAIEHVSDISFIGSGDYSATRCWDVRLRNDDRVEHSIQVLFSWEEDWTPLGGAAAGKTAATVKKESTQTFRIPPNAVKYSKIVMDEKSDRAARHANVRHLRYAIVAIDGKPLGTP